MPNRYIVSGPNLAAAPSPISQAVIAGDHLYLSGQLAVDATGTFRAGTARAESDLAFKNLFAAIEAAGFRREDLVFTEVACTDLQDLPELNALFAELFPEGRRPARTVHQVAALPYGGKIKVHGVAVRASKA
jgi:2-iminobutanoate/2-iminopropanoate deaminase